jgi:hypothetical protein
LSKSALGEGNRHEVVAEIISLFKDAYPLLAEEDSRPRQSGDRKWWFRGGERADFKNIAL